MKTIFSKSKNISDADLLTQYIHNGDLNTLGQLYSRYIDLVYGVCLKYLKDKEDSQDMVTQIFEKIAKSIRTSNIENFKPWLYVVTKNYCLMELRKKKHQNISIDDEHFFISDFMESNYTIHPIDEEDIISNEKALKNCIDKLKFQQKESIELFYFKELSYQQISLKMNIEVKKVKSYIQNAKRNLKICLENNHAK